MVSLSGRIPIPSPNTFSENTPSLISATGITVPSTTAFTETFTSSSTEATSSYSSSLGTPFALS